MSGVNTEEQPLAGLYQRYFQELCQFIHAKFGPPPEPDDVVQTAFVRFSQLDDPNAVENPRAFLYKVSQNIVLDYRRSAKTRDQYLQSELAAESLSDDCDPSNVLSAQEQLAIVMSTLEQLPNTQRQLVILNRIHHISYAEIARRTQLSQTEVKRQVARALATCSAALAAANHRPPESI